ncbi:MAG TPA: DNA-3-methyladenine glycosylase [Jatrophihabitans sp.]|nr:DNA-3-methyladenine glycosylase [Jatrophihabitans sp.]
MGTGADSVDRLAVQRDQLTGPALEVAPLLLGATLVSDVGGDRVVVRITEVEAYEGQDDPASHAFRGPTKRNAVMFGEAGHLYCYFIYGMHWCANITCQRSGTAGAVLLRAADIAEGEPAARDRTARAARDRTAQSARGRPATAVPAGKLASGPARLARSLGLTGSHTGLDLLSADSPVRLTMLDPPTGYRSGPRVGIAVAAEHPWRFWLPDAASVSAYRPGGLKRLVAKRQTGQP